MKCLSHRCRKTESLLKYVVKSARQLAITSLFQALHRHEVINTSFSRTAGRALTDKIKCSVTRVARDNDPIRFWAVMKGEEDTLLLLVTWCTRQLGSGLCQGCGERKADRQVGGSGEHRKLG